MTTPFPTVLLPFALAAALGAQTHDELAGRPGLQVDDAERLGRTRVTAHLRHPLEADGNLLWCATMQLAWDELETVFGTPPRLAEASPAADGLAARLIGKDDLDPRSYVARAGRGRDRIVARIREDLQRVFGAAASPRLLPADVAPNDVLAYAYLWKHLPFELPLRAGAVPLRFQQRDVASFGMWPDAEDGDAQPRRQQVRVLRYDGPQQFVVELRTKGEQDRLLVARGTPARTLHDTVAAVLRGAAKNDGEALGDRDVFQMPKLDFDLTKRFSELIGRKFANEGFRDHVVQDAVQNVRFKLDENGAILKSEAVISVTGMDATEPRRMVCDGPFLVLLARRGRALPYFALWVGNDELLLPARAAAGTAGK
jgi:hypothetical protein